MPSSSHISESQPPGVGLLGGGHRRSGRAGFVLNEVDVRLYGSSPSAVERVKMLTDARRSYRRLRVVPQSDEGAHAVAELVADTHRNSAPLHQRTPQNLGASTRSNRTYFTSRKCTSATALRCSRRSSPKTRHTPLTWSRATMMRCWRPPPSRYCSTSTPAADPCVILGDGMLRACSRSARHGVPRVTCRLNA